MRHPLRDFPPLLIFLCALSPVPGQEAGRKQTDLLQAVRSRGRIVVGLQKNFQPFHIENPRDGYPGLDVELAHELGRALGVKVHFVFLSLPGLLNAAENHEIDLALGGISTSLQRARDVRFATPYLVTSPGGLLSREKLPPESDAIDFPQKKMQGLQDIKDIGKLKIGVRGGTTNERLLLEDPFFQQHAITSIATPHELLEALQNNTIELLVADRSYIKALLIRYPGLRSRFIFLNQTYRKDFLSPVLPPGEPEFWLYVNFFLKELERTGIMGGLRRKYFDDGDWVQ